MGSINLARAAASSLVRGRPSSSPDVVLPARTIRVNPDRLAAFARACGFEPGSATPPTYPHVLAFDGIMRLMTRRDFPFALPGLIHMRNTITAYRRIDVGETLTFRVRAEGVAEHPKGRTVDILTSASANRELCWSERSTYLMRTVVSRAAPDDTPMPGGEQGWTSARAQAAVAAPTSDGPQWPTRERWDLPGTLGRRYARASGDWNPIHLSRWTARAFGLRRPIAHGMWTTARALSAMDELPDAFTVDVAFAAPVPLPSSVEFAGDGERFAVRPIDAPLARPHLTGTIGPPRACRALP